VTGATNPATHTFTSVMGDESKPMETCDADKKIANNMRTIRMRAR